MAPDRIAIEPEAGRTARKRACECAHRQTDRVVVVVSHVSTCNCVHFEPNETGGRRKAVMGFLEYNLLPEAPSKYKKGRGIHAPAQALPYPRQPLRVCFSHPCLRKHEE